MARLLISLALILSTSGMSSAASARKTIVLLDFGGEDGPRSRKRVLKFLKKSYNVYPGTKLLEACENLGIEMKRGRSLSRCAREIRAVAVVGGTTAAGKLHLVVYSGKTGEPLHTGAIDWSSPPTSTQISEAFRVLASGLSRAPASVQKSRPRPRPAAKPVPKRAAPEPAAGAPAAVPPTGPVVAAEPIYDPSQIGGADSGVQQAEDEEPGAAVDVLDPLGGLGGIAGVPYETEGEIESQPEDEYMGQGPPRKKGFQRNRPGIEATAGFGALIRLFDVSKSLTPPPTYDSGIAMGLRFAVIGRPLAFFYDDWLAGFFLRLRTDLSVGLRSTAVLQSQQKTLKMGTSILQLLVDMGWEWLILDDPEGPNISFGLGFGMQNFSVNWPDPASLQITESELKSLPDVSYRFLLFGVGATVPFAQRFSAYLRTHYRFVFGAGEIEDEQAWYGGAFVGGVGGSAGASVNFHGFLAAIEYGFTYYFYSFSGDRAARAAGGLRVAKTASDQYHTAMLSLGYAF